MIKIGLTLRLNHNPTIYIQILFLMYLSAEVFIQNHNIKLITILPYHKMTKKKVSNIILLKPTEF